MDVGIFGASGSVGKELLRLIDAKEPKWRVKLLNPRDAELSEGEMKQCQLIFFCTPADISQKWIDLCLETKTIAIDLSSAFRRDEQVPLVVPEINGDLLKTRPKIIASPNCVATLIALALAPILKMRKIKRLIAATYQAASGAGQKALDELEASTRAAAENTPFFPSHFPHPIAMNLFPHEGPQWQDGYNEEEEKIIFETRKILALRDLPISVHCVRVPVRRAHSIFLNVELDKPLSVEQAEELLRAGKGLAFDSAITPLRASEKNAVFIGKVRQDISCSTALELWIVGDQLLKGAALNAFQIGEILLT